MLHSNVIMSSSLLLLLVLYILGWFQKRIFFVDFFGGFFGKVDIFSIYIDKHTTLYRKKYHTHMLVTCDSIYLLMCAVTTFNIWKNNKMHLKSQTCADKSVHWVGFVSWMVTDRAPASITFFAISTPTDPIPEISTVDERRRGIESCPSA